VKLRVPPGRMGVMWLRERLAVADRAREVLEEKLEALTQERHKVRAQLAELEAEWRQALATAEHALLSAELAGGVAQVARVSALSLPASAEVTRGRTLGVSHPSSVEVTVPPWLATPWAQTSALRFAAAAYGEALIAGARFAATQRALTVLDREQERTVRRLRSIERRWMPELEAEVLQRARALDEAEREDTVRISWVARRAR